VVDATDFGREQGYRAEEKPVNDYGWHAVSLSNGIEPGRSAGTRVLEKEIVLWRDTDGAAHAWEDRCPHRGMRLSFGFVRGCQIACLYHGWRYDAQGRCRFIPAHPELDVPASIRVVTYPCVERLGMIWVYADYDIEIPPDLPFEASATTPVRSVFVECAPAAVLQALVGRSKNIGSAQFALLSVEDGGRSLIAGIQPFGLVKTALHIVLPGGPELHGSLARRAAAVWAEEFRNDLEHAAAAAGTAVTAQEVVS
jgi:nitrite reductase/ring-hydroxylating ferredoxin subunit